jgi:hypothetical protein
MPAGTEVTRLKRDIEALVAAVNLDLRPGSKTAMSANDKRSLKSDIQQCVQALDELATRLTG